MKGSYRVIGTRYCEDDFATIEIEQMNHCHLPTEKQPQLHILILDDSEALQNTTIKERTIFNGSLEDMIKMINEYKQLKADSAKIKKGKCKISIVPVNNQCSCSEHPVIKNLEVGKSDWIYANCGNCPNFYEV